ncbi:hypothetical protein DFP72DRAFT_1098059 [Ephemerocybe angulata]|uniref:Uncharacterized protein n=1 Tax=Ephemerocybe angulata TaxID=980116 RepID=A0A8H6HCN1_9AGAR|nr:hypothetical protein DFP72DRAFT_1098059 [Tulosesus angulatus]
MSSSLSTNIVVGRKQRDRRIKRGHHRDRGKPSRSADLLVVVPVYVGIPARSLLCTLQDPGDASAPASVIEQLLSFLYTFASVLNVLPCITASLPGKYSMPPVPPLSHSRSPGSSSPRSLEASGTVHHKLAFAPNNLPKGFHALIFYHRAIAVHIVHESTSPPHPPFHKRVMQESGEAEQETGGITRGSARKTGKVHGGTPGECTRGAKRVRDAGKLYRADGAGLVLRSNQPRALEKPESRVVVWIARLSIREPRGKHRQGAGGKATPSLERRWAVGGTDGGGVVGSSIGRLAPEDVLAPASRKCVSALDNRVFSIPRGLQLHRVNKSTSDEENHAIGLVPVEVALLSGNILRLVFKYLSETYTVIVLLSAHKSEAPVKRCHPFREIPHSMSEVFAPELLLYV